MHMTFKELQKNHSVWAAKNFPFAATWEPLVGAMEELGELSHAHLKCHQGIRTNEDHKAKKADAVGDIILYLAHYCSMAGIDMQTAVEMVWSEVSKRDWIANPENGSS